MLAPPNYHRLYHQLAAPPPRTLSAGAWIEQLHPHDPPGDEEWRTPRSLDTARDWMARMEFAPMMVCALTAAEMFVAWWAEHPNPLGDAWSPAEAQAHLNRYWRWLGRHCTADSFDVPTHRVPTPVLVYESWDAPGEWNCSQTYRAFFAIERALSEVEHWAGGLADARENHGQAAAAVRELLGEIVAVMTATAEFVAGRRIIRAEADVRREFLSRWWKRCQCRLAVADARTVAIEWAAELPVPWDSMSDDDDDDDAPRQHPKRPRAAKRSRRLTAFASISRVENGE